MGPAPVGADDQTTKGHQPLAGIPLQGAVRYSEAEGPDLEDEQQQMLHP